MAPENFRGQVRRAMDAISGPPSAALTARVRSAIQSAPERPPLHWVAGLAAAALAVTLVVVMLVANPAGRPGPILLPGSNSSPSPSSVPSQTPSPAPSPAPSPVATPDATLPPFVCGSTNPLTVQGAPSVAFVDAVRTGTHPGYDRLTIQFQNGAPGGIEVRPQGSPTFTRSPRGDQVTLLGRSGLLIVLHSADAHSAYSGPADFKTGYPVLLEASQLEDFEGYVQWGLGLSNPACYRFFLLTNPARLVIDVQTP